MSDLAMSILTLPDLGEGLHEAEIVTWHVSEGDNVVTDQPLVSVETDKAVVEIPSPYSARVTRLFGQPGDRLTVGDQLVEFEAVEAAADTGTVVGDIATVAAASVSAPAAPSARSKATPGVRALARKLGVNPSIVQGTGPDGVTTKGDVERAARILAAAAAAEPLRGVRRAMADRMSKAHAEVPRATVTDEADVEAWNKSASVTPRLIRAIVAGCRAAPALDAWFDRAEMTRRLHPHVDLGIAVDTEDGLFVPVLRNVGERTPRDLQQVLDSLKQDVRARTVPPSELRGQTITLSNFGTVGGKFAELVVVPPAGDVHPLQIPWLGIRRVPWVARGSRRRRVVRRARATASHVIHCYHMGWLSTNTTSSRRNPRTDPDGISAPDASGAAITTSGGCGTRRRTGCRLEPMAATGPSSKSCAIIYSA